MYDASARGRGPSLNDCLHADPRLYKRILDILLRLRTYRVAFAADIEKAFLNISVAPSDRDVLRFSWITDLEDSPPDISIMRFTRVCIWNFIQPISVECHGTKAPRRLWSDLSSCRVEIDRVNLCRWCHLWGRHSWRSREFISNVTTNVEWGRFSTTQVRDQWCGIATED